MTEDKAQFRELFISKILDKKKVSLLDDEEAELKDDGSVNFFDGISILIFSELDVFADHYFLDKHVPYQVCQYVGDTDSDGNIVWHSIPAQDEEGKWYQKAITFKDSEIITPGPDQKVFTKPVSFT